MPSYYTNIVSGAEIVPSRLTAAGDSIWEEIIYPGTYPKIKIKPREGLCVTRAFKVPADLIDVFGIECSNSTFVDQGRHPQFPNVYITDVDLDPFGEDGAVQMRQTGFNVTEPEYWMAVVNYECRKFSPVSGQSADNSNGADLLDGTVNVTSEVLLIDGAGFKWAGDTTNIAEHIQMPKTIPIIDREIKIPRLMLIPWVPIRACVGCVNKVAYSGALPETLLYLGASVGFRFAFDGSLTYSLTHKFKEKGFLVYTDATETTTMVATWNHFYRKTDKLWKKTKPLVYTPIDFGAAGLIPGVS